MASLRITLSQLKRSKEESPRRNKRIRENNNSNKRVARVVKKLQARALPKVVLLLARISRRRRRSRSLDLSQINQLLMLKTNHVFAA